MPRHVAGAVAPARRADVAGVRALPAFRSGRLLGPAMHRRLAKRLQVRNLIVKVSGPAGVVARSTMSPFRAFARWG